MAREGRLRARPTVLGLKTRASGCTDTRVLYALPVSEPNVDREAWATLIADLIQREAGGNKAAFARLVGLKTVKTLDRWLAEAVNVRAETVSQVARALNLPAFELLAKVGYVHADEALLKGLDTIAEDRKALAYVRAQEDLPERVRRDIETSLLQTIATQEEALMQQAQRMVEIIRRQRGQAG